MKTFFALFFLSISLIASSHSGRTDSSGGHYNRSTGDYHYHGGGKSKSFDLFKGFGTSSKSKKELIEESIRNYPGSCPCPYSRASNGSHCGKRSAWSKPGGYAPKCYESDF